MQDLASYSMAMNLAMSMGGIPDLPVDPLAIDFVFDGSFAMDETARVVAVELNSMMMGMLGSSAEDMTTAADMQQMMLDLYGGMDMSFTMQYMVAPEVAALLSADSEIPMPESLTFEIRLIDGIMYMNVADLRALDPSMAEELTSDWIGIDYVGMLQMQMDQGAMGEDPMTSAAASGLAMSEMMSRMEDFVAVERLDDVALDGQDGAVFAYTLDIIGFLTSDLFRTAMEEMTASLGEDTSAAELREALSMIDFVAPMLFRDLDIATSTVIGLDDKLTHNQSFDLTWDLASLMQLAAMSDPSVAEALGDAEPVVTFGFTADYSDFNDEMIFEVPEDAQMIPLEQLLPQDTSAVF
jgi:hypothetical protein